MDTIMNKQEERNKLKEQLIAANKISNEIQQRINKLDEEENTAKAESLVGRYFALRFNEDQEDKPYGYAKIVGHGKLGKMLIGIEITERNDNDEDDSRPSYTIGINEEIFIDSVEFGYEITKSEFESLYERALKELTRNI